jgi:asparagine synthase (glutamine-hydrolysing)
VPIEIIERPKQPYRAPDAASFFAGGEPDWLDAVTSTDAVTAAGQFSPTMVARLLAKCRTAGGRGLSNTDNMRLVSVLSIQLLHSQFIERGHALRSDPPSPMAVFDYVGAHPTRTEE